MPIWNRAICRCGTNDSLIRPAIDVDAHRPLDKDQDLGSILSQVERRMIGQDYTLRDGSQLYQVDREQIQPRLRGQLLRVEQLSMDGSWCARRRAN